MSSQARSGPSPPVVSVIVATRNRPDLLRQCLGAIAAQTYTAIEVLVADDGSSATTRDAYRTLCPALGDRLRFLLAEHPDAPGTGPAAARNRGIRAATGEFLAFCDDDDRWIRDDHLACGVRALEATGADFFFTNVLATHNGEPSNHIWFPEQHRLTVGASVLADAQVFAGDLATVMAVVGGTVIHPDCWVVRTSLVRETGGFWERLWFSEDYELMMRVLDRVHTVLFRPEPCVDYRLPVADSVSLRSSPLETLLQEIMAAQHARALCGSRVIRQHARAREAWGLRRLARELRGQGQHQQARAFARQGFATYPTWGALLQWLRLK
jgi:glycosyltransferase involved in cell wall biosynthesis